ncbi:MAG TPA: hypothetical protein VKG01_09970 [Thermoanaerobaculia bacterium]|nr:hypothetical protein [Thermoanaerobaculia bacterium]
MKTRIAAIAFAALAFGAAVAFAYNIKLKDGSLIFARSKYEVKGTKAIITLQNGTVTQIDLALIDVPGTEQYNKENPGNVIALQQGEDREIKLPTVKPVPTVSLQDVIRQRKTRFGEMINKLGEGAPPPPGSAAAGSWQPVESTVETAFRRVLDGAAMTQYRLTNFRGRLRLLATVNSEEAVFNMLSASARAIGDLIDKGKPTTVDIVLTTSSGDSAGTFEMTADQARALVNGNLSVADYFIKNVVL